MFSPTEAAGVACIYAIFVSYFIYREVTLVGLFETAARAMYLTGLIFIIVSVAGLYAWLLTISGIAQQGAAFIAGTHAEPWMVLLTINVFLLFVGCFLDPASALIMLTPLLAPIAASRRQSDPFRRHRRDEPDHRHLQSPFGLNIFVCQALFKTPSATLYMGLIPFVTLAVIALLMVTYIPAISLWLLKYLL